MADVTARQAALVSILADTVSRTYTNKACMICYNYDLNYILSVITTYFDEKKEGYL